MPFIELEVIDPANRTLRGTTLLSVSQIVAVSTIGSDANAVTAIYTVGTDDYLGPIFTSMPYGEIKSVLLAPERAAA